MSLTSRGVQAESYELTPRRFHSALSVILEHGDQSHIIRSEDIEHITFTMSSTYDDVRAYIALVLREKAPEHLTRVNVFVNSGPRPLAIFKDVVVENLLDGCVYIEATVPPVETRSLLGRIWRWIRHVR